MPTVALEVMYEESGDFLHEPDEWFPGTLTQLEADEGQYGPTIKWYFILDEDVIGTEGRETWAWSAQKVTTKNKTGRWLTAIKPGIEVGQTIDLSKLEGSRVDVMFERSVKTDGSAGERVSKLRASKVPAPDPAGGETPFEQPVSVSQTTGKPQSADDLFT